MVEAEQLGDRVSNLREQVSRERIRSAWHLGWASLNGYGAFANEGLWRVGFTVGAVSAGVTAGRRALEAMRHEAQADVVQQIIDSASGDVSTGIETGFHDWVAEAPDILGYEAIASV